MGNEKLAVVPDLTHGLTCPRACVNRFINASPVRRGSLTKGAGLPSAYLTCFGAVLGENGARRRPSITPVILLPLLIISAVLISRNSDPKRISMCTVPARDRVIVICRRSFPPWHNTVLSLESPIRLTRLVDCRTR